MIAISAMAAICRAARLRHRGDEVGGGERGRHRQIGRDQQRDAPPQPEIDEDAVERAAGVAARRHQDVVAARHRPRPTAAAPAIGWPLRGDRRQTGRAAAPSTRSRVGSARRCATATSIAPRSSCSAASPPVSGSRRSVALRRLRAQKASASRPTSATSAYSAMPAVKVAMLFAGSKPTPRLSAASICSIAADDQRRDLARPRGRLHAGRGAHEQIVGEQAAQARQGVAHRRLRQADAAGGAGHGALADQRVEGFQQVEVDGAYIHATNG